MITYKPMKGFPGVKTPVLHRVVYAHTTDGVASRYQNSYRDWQVRLWCQANCRAGFYMHPGWTQEKFVQFEDDQDAVLFALTYGN